MEDTDCTLSSSDNVSLGDMDISMSDDDTTRKYPVENEKSADNYDLTDATSYEKQGPLYKDNYNVFLAHSNVDAEFVKSVMDTLEQRGVSCCYSKRDFRPGATTVSCINEALTKCKSIILFLSKDFLTSPWCEHKRDMALHKAAEKGKDKVRVVPILIDVNMEALPMNIQLLTHIRQDENCFQNRLLFALGVQASDDDHRPTYAELEAMNMQLTAELEDSRRLNGVNRDTLAEMQKRINALEMDRSRLIKQCNNLQNELEMDRNHTKFRKKGVDEFGQAHLTAKLDARVSNSNNCLGQVVPAICGRLVRSFKVKLKTSSHEVVSHVATDTNGDVLVGIFCNEDISRNRIQIYDGASVLRVTIKKPRTAKMDAFCGVAVDHDGNIVTRCQGSNKIIVYTKTGDRVRTFHSESPDAVAVNNKGHYVVAGENTLTVYDSQGDVLLTTKDPAGKFVKYVSCNVNGDVIVTDPGAHHIRVYDSTLQLRYKYGSKGDGDGQLNIPLGSCCLDNGDILLSDTLNHRVHLVSKDGQFKQFLLTEAHGLQWRKDVAINHLGQLVVAEQEGTIKAFQL